MSPTAWPAATCLRGERSAGVKYTVRILTLLKKGIFQSAYVLTYIQNVIPEFSDNQLNWCQQVPMDTF